MVVITISANTNRHVSGSHLNHRGGCQCDFDKSKSLLMSITLSDTSPHRLAVPAEQSRRCNSSLTRDGRYIGALPQGFFDTMGLTLTESQPGEPTNASSEAFSRP